jgi:2-phosphosulfolactate phosphatase
MKIETILTPAELPALAQRNLRATACVVFDILRATSTFVTALQNGAAAIIPVSEISEAVARRQQQPDVLLAGERDGIKIRAAQSGGIDFDFGNSPREFTAKIVRGKTIVSTTTNGTRALRACLGSKIILASSFLNLAATAKFLQKNNFAEVLLVCAGTGEGMALEDVLAAGGLVELLIAGAPLAPTLSPRRGEGEGSGARLKLESSVPTSRCLLLDDATEVARQTFLRSKADLSAVIAGSKNGCRLLAIPELRADVAFCSQRDIFNIVAEMKSDGAIRCV